MRWTEDLGASHGWRLRRGVLDDGRVVFAKTGAVSPVFTSEAEGLRWLGAAIAVPEVIEVSRDRLVLSWVDTSAPTAAAAERFGRDLARLHRAGAPAFGAPWPGFIADLPMDNSPADDWPAFYATRRVLPFVRQARLPARDVALIERAVVAVRRGGGVTGAAGAYPRRPVDRERALVGRATGCSSTRRRTAGIGRRTWRCWRCSGRPIWIGSWASPGGDAARGRVAGAGAAASTASAARPCGALWRDISRQLAGLPWRECWLYEPVLYDAVL